MAEAVTYWTPEIEKICRRVCEGRMQNPDALVYAGDPVRLPFNRYLPTGVAMPMWTTYGEFVASVMDAMKVSTDG